MTRRWFGYVGTLGALVLWAGRDGVLHGASAFLLTAGAIVMVAAPLLALDEVLARLPFLRRTRGVAPYLATALVALPLAAWLGMRLVPLWPARMFWVFPAALVAFAAAVIVVGRHAIGLGLPEARRYWFAVVVYGAALDALFWWVHETEGTLDAIRPGTETLHLALFAGTAAMTLGLALIAAARPWLIATTPPWRSRSRMVLATAVAALGLALLEADRRALVDLYPAVHTWLGVTGLLALDTALRLALSCLPRRTLSTAGPVALAAVVGLAAGFWPARGWAKKPTLRSALATTPQGWITMSFLPNRTHQTSVHPEMLPLLDYPRYHDRVAPVNTYNVLFISVDTLRADMIGPARSPVAAAPRLAQFAADAIRFRNAYAQGPRTSLAMSALFLGRYSATIDWKLHVYKGGRVFDPDGQDDGREGKTRGFAYTTIPEMPAGAMLGERMRAAGLRTMAAPYAGKNRFFAKGEGFDRGFDRYEDLSENQAWEIPTSDKITEVALRQIDGAAGARWFQWLHYYDPHESGHDRTKYEKLVSAFDTSFGALVDGLKQRGLWENTAIFLVADHGEAFGEHGNAGHSSSLYDEQIKVPLVMRIPHVAARDEAQAVAAIDATATMLALVRGSTEGLDGVNLLPLVYERAYPKIRPVFMELHRYYAASGNRTADMKSVVLDGWKLIYNRKNDTWMLFDLTKDPKERQNRLASATAQQERLRKLLETFLAKAEKQHPLP